ncbi:MAG: glycosyltransferase family 4 protein [Gemmataceae bacterium]
MNSITTTAAEEQTTAVAETASEKLENGASQAVNRSLANGGAVQVMQRPMSAPVNRLPEPDYRAPTPPILALCCFQEPDSMLGRYVSQLASCLAERSQVEVHLFTRHLFDDLAPCVHHHAVGDPLEPNLLEQARIYAERVQELFRRQFPEEGRAVTLLGFDWQTVPVLTGLQPAGLRAAWLSLHSIEWQRSDMSNELSQHILELERVGLRSAQRVLVADETVAKLARELLPECEERVSEWRQVFPLLQLPPREDLDHGAVKARFNIGPIDPTILFIGDMDDRHGPDILMKTMPTLLRNNPQVRLILVGDGPLLWPMRVYARYLLLEHAVRVVGHLEGQPLFDLIQAANVIAVPSRENTEDWQIMAAWSLKRPVVTTHTIDYAFLEHEHNCVLTYPHENSCIWGIERLLFDPRLAEEIAANGHKLAHQRAGWNIVAAQLEELLGVAVATT